MDFAINCGCEVLIVLLRVIIMIIFLNRNYFAFTGISIHEERMSRVEIVLCIEIKKT